MKNQTSFSHSARTRFALSCLLAAIALPACYDIEIETETPVEPTADSYSVDIYMLSELAGRILPQPSVHYICEKNDSDNSKFYSYHEKTKDSSAQLTEDINISTNSNDDLIYSIEKYGFTEESTTRKLETVACTKDEGASSCTEVFEDRDIWFLKSASQLELKTTSTIPTEPETPTEPNAPTDTPETSDQEPIYKTFDKCYEATIYNSGLIEINNLWRDDKVTDSAPTSIYVGSGDNFGVSSIQSHVYNDEPTIMALNTIGLTADTFGNHSFDKNLNYLKNIISLADYHFVSSNLTYQPQNLGEFNLYTRVDLQAAKNADGSSANPLTLAIVGAIDPNIVSSVYPGRFGSIGFGAKDSVSRYCYTIQALEKAYNEGARAFLILGHIDAKNQFAAELYTALFYLIKKDYVVKVPVDAGEENNSNPKKPTTLKTAISEFSCPTKLNASTDPIKAHREIFNGLIGIFGTATDTQTITQIDEQKINSLYEETEKETPDKNVITQILNGGTHFTNEQCSHPLMDTQYLQCSSPQNEPKGEDAFWIFNFPSKGINTVRAKITIQKTDQPLDSTETEEDNQRKNSYKVAHASFNLTPVFSHPLNDSLGDCDTFFKTEKSNNESIKTEKLDAGDAEACYNYYEALTDTQTYSEINNEKFNYTNSLLSKFTSHTDNINIDTSSLSNTSPLTIAINNASECYKYIKSLSNVSSKKNNEEENHSELITRRDHLTRQLTAWSCIYNTTNKEVGPNDFQPREISDINIKKTQKSDLRVKTTYLGNLITQSVFEYYTNLLENNQINDKNENNNQINDKNENNNQINDKNENNGTSKYDLLYFNAGIVRETEETLQITSDWLLERLPYENKTVALEIVGKSIKETDKQEKVYKTSGQFLADIVDFGLIQKEDGGFPMMAGAVAAYDIDNEKKLCELWTTDDDNSLKELLYYNTKCNVHITSLPDNIKNSLHNGVDDIKVQVTISNSQWKLSKDADKYTITSSNESNDSKLHLKDGIYSTNDKLHILTPDYLKFGGDNYDKVMFHHTMKRLDDKAIDKVIASFLEEINNSSNPTNYNDFKARLNYNHLVNDTNTPDTISNTHLPNT